jgi:hypothetical protein
MSWIALGVMDLRDKFAVQIAAALAGALSDPAQIARRSYDYADALLAERARRIEAEEACVIAGEFNPDELDSEWLEERFDPTWDVEVRWDADAAPDTSRAEPVDFESVRPGLARTQPADVETLRVAGTGA